ncbi:MAG: DUF3516 domain-containing protein [Acidobacteriota bacterium]
MTKPLDSTASDAARPSLAGAVDPTLAGRPEAILDAFIDWTSELGFELFEAQEEALLELMAGNHVVLNTPTGSGKSLVAAGLHFKALCEGRKSVYTSPIKALASEKFFDLCRDFGAERVGMLTGDATINPGADLLCCTAEVLANMALRRGAELDMPYVVMDEFHYYADRERGVAWQVPLIELEHAQFLLMSATIGNPAHIQEKLEERSGRSSVVVRSDHRPVPLDYEYRTTPIHETIQDLHESGKSPIYVVNFTQRECAELAQSLTSLKLLDREQRMAVRAAMGDFRFDTAYGKEIRRILGFGVGVHHAGLLPKYRLLVEQLAQQGLLRVICGTDTLGVGVNIPIRTVLFNKLCKYDGTSTVILPVRDFKQIGGRAGRQGHDTEGTVVCQAPEHVIENKRLELKIAGDPKKAKKAVRKQPPTRGYVHWDEDTFRKLIDRPPEALQSSFHLNHGLLLNLIQQDIDRNDPNRRNFHSLRELIAHCHESDERKRELISEAAQLVRSLLRAGILRATRDVQTSYWWIDTDPDLQIDFSLHQNLSLFLVETLDQLEIEADRYALDVLSLSEAILEDPHTLLRKQADKARDIEYHRLKAEDTPYEELRDKLDLVTYPKPNAEAIYAAFDTFRSGQPWLRGDNIRPKGIGREMFEGYASFGDFIKDYGLKRSEGLLLRYLSQLYKVLAQTIPEQAKTDEVWEMAGFFHATLAAVDTSLLTAWESQVAGEDEGTSEERQAAAALQLLHSPQAVRARIRGELFAFVRALARQEWEEAEATLRHDGDPWTADRLRGAMEPYFTEYEELLFTPEARQSHMTHFEEGDDIWRVRHSLLDPEGDLLWGLEAEVDVGSLRRGDLTAADPALSLRHLGP